MFIVSAPWPSIPSPPMLVLISWLVRPEPMTLVLNLFKLMALIVGVRVTILISIDGRAKWLEEAKLIALYVG